MSSDKASEQYPTVAVCDACSEVHSKGEDAQIVTASSYDPCDGDECYFCDKTPEEEDEEGRDS